MGYTINKELIMEAWSKYRPSSDQQKDAKSPEIGTRTRKNSKATKDINTIFGEAFINKLL